MIVPLSNLLEKAIEEASHLSKAEQDALAEILLAEIEDEKRWNESFAKSHKQLEKLGDEALENFKEGRTEILDPNNS